MKIIKLSAENIKRLKAIEITPDGPVVKISGRNAQGKTTVLDSIWWALGGAKAIQEEPIRHGAHQGTIQLELDDLIVTRTFTPDNSYLKVENKQGATYKSPQAVLDKLIGQLSFDPLAFARADAKKQRDLLLEVTGLKVDTEALADIAGTETANAGPNAIDIINGYYKEVYDARTVVNRQLDVAKKVLASLPDVEPVEAVSVTTLLQERRALEQEYIRQEAIRNDLVRYEGQRSRLEQEIRELMSQIQIKEKELESVRMLHATHVDLVRNLRIVDFATVDDQIANAEATNQQAQAYRELQKQANHVAALQAEADAYTGRLEAIKAYKVKLMADARFPIEGLGFSANGVTYHGVPLEQASAAEKLQVSLAMAMALNPELRVVRVDDASLLDADHMALIEEMARENDYQVWMEIVDASGAVGIYIEDGEVRPGQAVAQ